MSVIDDPLNVEDESIVFRSRQAFLLFTIMVAGKNGKRTVKLTERLLDGCRVEYRWEEDKEKPFERILRLKNEGKLLERLKELGTGQYRRIRWALVHVARHIDPDNTSVDELQAVNGIGPKTARYFMMRAHGERHAALDTHVLKWLRSQGYDAPKGTPQSKRRYNYLETVFINEADLRGMTPDELDIKVWRHYAYGEEYPK